MVVFLGIRPGQVPEEHQPEGLEPFRDWQAACSVPNRLICSVSGVRDPSVVDKLSTGLWLGLRRRVFICVGWQVTLCDPIWQVTPYSSEMEFH